MKEQASHLLILAFFGMVNGIGQVVMRWGGRGAKVALTMHTLPAWLFSSRFWLLGLTITWSSGLAWAFLLRSVRLVIALPLFAGISYLLTVLGAVVLLGERPTVSQYAGLMMVITGVLLIVVRR